MKKILSILTTFILITPTVSSVFSCQKLNPSKPETIPPVEKVSSRKTIYIDSNGLKQETEELDFLNIDAKEILELGFSKYGETVRNFQGNKVPKELPKQVNSLFSFLALNKNLIIENLEDWDTSNITSMSQTFRDATNFNTDISKWNTSNVTDMNEMFYECKKINFSIKNWDTSKVKSMSSMFQGANIAKQDLSNWNTSNVKNMSGMFLKAQNFNQDIGNWNTSNVTNMRSMFYEAQSFNQDIGNWNTSNVMDMNSMFKNSPKFNQDISKWNINKVTLHDDFDFTANRQWIKAYKPKFERN
ncbi:BspA family leucine-rich repeat surface protein [Spiroplasma floricola]|uniref:BspA family leucine-rich repeat surface protein n=1 Tax=Spiroplasma floricola 23-6 TaxID=1336749 RepID=A0A2K8SDM9_9MOLU|nr:BspA family leucine-rich repeat surface protein [Spiroplasma floricola]AUB31559.1 BspA family leucine-rich repeat surface protein [Spiroplasma floricola 23-6]